MRYVAIVGWVLGGLVSYAFVAGLAARYFKRIGWMHHASEYGTDCEVRRIWLGNAPIPGRECECSTWAIFAAFWPFVLASLAAYTVLRHVLVRPIITAAQAGFALHDTPQQGEQK